MVAVLLKLKWANFTAAFRAGSLWVILGTVFGGLYTLGIAFGLGAAGLFIGADSAFIFFGFFGLVLTLAWWIVPLVASGADPTLDPEMLAPYPLKATQLMGGQALGALIGLPGFATLVLSLATITSLIGSGAGLALYPVSLLLGLALVILGSRLVTVASIPLRSRRGISNALTMIAFTTLIFTGPLIMGVTGGIAALYNQMPAIMAALQWTPLVAPWAIAPQAALGNWGLAGLLTLLSVMYILVTLLLWKRATERTMANVGALAAYAPAKTLKSGNLGLLGKLPDGPRWAITARTLHMMLKDPRCNVNVLSVPLFYVLFIIMGATGAYGDTNFMGVFMLTVFLPAFAGYMFAYLIPFENTAFSLHVTAPLRGIDDRLGRAYAMLILSTPWMLVGSIAFALLGSLPAYLGAILLTTLGVYLVSLGLAMVVDMVFSIPVAPPGASPWKTPKQPDGVAKMFVRGLMMFIPMILSAPGVAGMIAQAITGNQLWGWVGGATNLGVGAICLWLGAGNGAKRFETNAAEALQRVARFN